MYECGDFTKSEVDRYGRQMNFSDFGIKGQICLRDAKALIVGCGGLGCPAGIYLATAGVGKIGLVDHDTVELSNLHRQVAHNENNVGVQKAESMKKTLESLNSSSQFVTYNTQLTHLNAMDIFKEYDIILDCTDNVPTRYLINDCAVILKKPIVSASAIGLYGQMSVYNYNGGPCYRCMYPRPPPASTVVNCNDGGVIGPIPGLLGVMQAIETIKILCNIGTPMSAKLFNYSAYDNSFNTYKMRSRMSTCAVCGDNPTITELIDYEEFCGMAATDACGRVSILSPDERVSVEEYNKVLITEEPHVLIDVRPEVQLRMCKFTHAVEVDMKELSGGNVDKVKVAIEQVKERLRELDQCGTVRVFVFCRLGNDSQSAVRLLQSLVTDNDIEFRDVIGGMTAWAREMKPDLPVY